MRIQILLFLKRPETVSEVPANEGSGPQGYALTSSEWQNHYPLKFLEQSVPVVSSHDQFNPPPNEKFEMIEVWEDDKFCSTSIENNFRPRSWSFRLYVDSFNIDLVRRLFPKNKSGIEFITGFRHSAIQSALDEENLKAIEKLLLSGADISYRHPEGGTLAHFAAEKASGPLIKLLHKCGTDLNVGRKDSAMPLHVAVKNGFSKIVEILLENGADVNVEMNDGYSSLHLATEGNFPNTIEVLLKNRAHINAIANGGWTPLHLAADMGNMKICTILLGRRASLSVEDVGGATPLHIALKKQRSAVARKLIDHGASLDAQYEGRNALQLAIAANDLETVEKILNCHPNLQTPANRKAFHLAFGKNGSHNKKMIERMMECGFTLKAQDAKVADVFFGAIQKNLYEIVVKLLEYGADVNQHDFFFRVKTRPINVACQYADKEMVQLLLDHGADPLLPRGIGRYNTPMADAVEFGKVEVVKLLLDMEIPIRHRPDLLFKAVCEGHIEKIELLLENAVDPNQMTSYRHHSGTAVSLALCKKEMCLVETLMRYGARFDYRDISRSKVSDNRLEAFLDYGFVDLDDRDKAWLRIMFDEYNGPPKRCAKALARHIIKLRAAGKIIPNNCFRLCGLTDFRSECEKEIANLKSKTIGRTEITFFDILTRNIHQIALYLRNASVLQTLTNYGFKSEFPIFGSIVDCKFRQGSWRRTLIDRAVKVFTFITSQFIENELPYEVTEHITNFLDTRDLIIFQKSFVKK